MMTTQHPLASASELCRFDVGELTTGFAAGTFTPLDVARDAIARAKEVQAQFNAFSVIDEEAALATAADSTARWQAGAPLSPIDGVPTTIKDIVWVKDRPIRYGSRTTSEAPCSRDAPSVKRLRAGGAVFLGITTTPEFGWKGVTDSPLTGLTRNPWDPEMTPGGSSGGAVVAAATGAGVLHIGTDGGGSIRIPCSFTGVTGLKPTFGRVAAYPASAFGTLAHIGPIARSASGAAAMLKVMAGRDLDDWNQGAGDLGPIDLEEGVLKDARVGLWMEPLAGRVDPEVAAAVKKAALQLEALGARVEAVKLPDYDLPELFRTHWFAGAANRFRALSPDLAALCDPGFVEVAQIGASIPATALIEAQKNRAAFGAEMDRLLTSFDFLLSPATAIPAFPAGPASREIALERAINSGCFSSPINLSQQPAASTPCGMTASGLPIGLQFVGARGADGKVLSAVRDFERARA